jgi:hypothetical protein
MSAPITLPTEDRTLIDNENQIYFCLSPIHLRLQNAAQDSTIQSVYVYLWVWNGDQDKALNAPSRTLFKKKISASDTYINFEIASYIEAFLKTPDNARNTFQPSFGFNVFSEAAITGQGVFWQIVADVTSDAGTVRYNFESNFATLGYRWNYEQNSLGNNGLAPNGSTGFLGLVNRWYSSRVSQYFSQSFNLTNSVDAATTANMITRASVTPPTDWTRCALDACLIVYINKLGLWDIFTPHGKISVSSAIESREQGRAYRDPSQVDNTYQHSKARTGLDVTQEYVINTGSLTEDMINSVEQIIYSPKVYLIKFNGEIQETTTVGITIDSTLVSIDNTNITIDSDTIESEYIGTYKDFEQIPVIVKDSNFVRKNRVNDKTEINYNIKFEETNNKMLNIR